MSTRFSFSMLTILILLFCVNSDKTSEQYPECSDGALAIHCTDEPVIRILGIHILCIAKSQSECDAIPGMGSYPALRMSDKGEITSLLRGDLGSPAAKRMIARHKYIVCFNNNDVDEMPPAQELNCKDNPDGVAFVPFDQWTDYVIERRDELREQRERIWEEKQKEAKEFHERTKETGPKIPKLGITYKHTHKLRVWQKGYKSVQGQYGDCVMHSLNAILQGNYITNYVMGHLFGDELFPLKVYEETKEKERAEKTPKHDFVAVYDNPKKTGEPQYYEAFGKRVINKALATFNAEEREMEIWQETREAFVNFDFFKQNQEDLAKELKTLHDNANLDSTDPAYEELKGLRFTYKASFNEYHSVGIQFINPLREKHWRYVQSWKSEDILKFTDEELAEYLFEASVHHKTYGWDKHLYIVTVKKGEELLPPPSKSIFKNDHMLETYYQCIQQHLTYRTSTTAAIRKSCEIESKRTKISAMREYENNIYYDYDDDMDILYDYDMDILHDDAMDILHDDDMDILYDDDELQEMREINGLKQLRAAEQYPLNRLIRQYNSRQNEMNEKIIIIEP